MKNKVKTVQELLEVGFIGEMTIEQENDIFQAEKEEDDAVFNSPDQMSSLYNGDW